MSDVASTSAQTADEIIAMVQAGEPGAGAYLVSVCGSRLLSYVRMIAPNLGQADHEEICETAIERAVQQIENFDPELGTFDSWIRGFARFVLLELRRRGTAVATSPSALKESPRGAESPEVERHNNAAGPIVIDAISSLRETDQLIIRLRDYEQLSYGQIAQLLNVEEAACRQRHLRALARLRTNLQSHPDINILLARSASE